MTHALYLEDCYLKEFKAKVSSVKDGKYVVLDKTAFYPNAGGQPYDTGVMIKEANGEKFKVIYVGKFGGEISHEVDKEGLKEGDKIKGKIDWERRYKLMRYHTAAHVLSKVVNNESGALMSGNQLGLKQSRIDFALENFNKEKVQEWVEKANQVIKKNKKVTIRFMPKKEALKIEDLVRTYKDLLPQQDVLRIIEIEGFDVQACGGTHLKNIGEIGTIELVKTKNKGKNNRRIYFKIKP